MLSSSAPELQVWKLVLKCLYGELGIFVCERRCCGLFWVFSQKHCKRGGRTLKKNLGILGDSFCFLIIKLGKTNLVI